MSVISDLQGAQRQILRAHHIVAFKAYGLAKPGGSKRGFVNRKTGAVIITDTSGKPGKDWRAVVATAGAEAQGDRPLLRGPLDVTIAFTVPRPKGHFRTGKNSDLVRDAVPRFPEGRPDVLKLARAVEDALTGVVWQDDAQIVTEWLSKRYGEPAGVFVSVAPANDADGFLIGSEDVGL
jgi:Holliday junction resolvase RusA-like endonuclease